VEIALAAEDMAFLVSWSGQQFHAGVNRSLKIRQSVVALLNLPNRWFVAVTWITVQSHRNPFRRAWGGVAALSGQDAADRRRC
jgi:hypothetical protein